MESGGQGSLTPQLVAVGNALIDIFAATDEELGPCLGLYPNQAVHVSPERLASILEMLPNAVAGSGGGTANTAKLAARLGVPTAFIGCIGTTTRGEPDLHARLFEKELREAKVLPILMGAEGPTGRCVIIRMPGGFTATAACPAAALGLKAHHIPNELIQTAKVVCLDGFLLGRDDLVSRVFKLAEQYGTVVSVDMGSPSIAAEQARKLAEYGKKYPCIIFMNQLEAEAFCNALQVGMDQTEKGPYAPIQQLTKDDIFPIIVVKKGPKGAFVFAGGDIHKARTVAAVPFDVTGAGDAFAAGFLSAWIANQSLADCAKQGNRLAREILKVPGTGLEPERLRRILGVKKRKSTGA